MRRHKRKPRVVWLPPDPYNRVGKPDGLTSPDEVAIGAYTFATASGGPGNFNGAIVALTGDRPSSENLVVGLNPSVTGVNPATFADLYDNGYRLRRICGGIWCALKPKADQATGDNVNYMFTAAIQVMEADRGAAQDVGEAIPDIYQTVDNPWIWRRSWLLSNFENVQSPPVYASYGTVSNVGFYNVREGAFIDQKTIRKVGPDHRLFLCLQCTNLDGNQASDIITDTYWWWNLRFVASLMTNLGNRGNSAR